jgi:hypothetical protein
MKRLILFAALSVAAHAAIPNTAIWEIRSSATSANANAGGFDYGNASFATDLACTSATGNAAVCTSASYTFVAGDQDAWLFVQAGTNWFANQFCPIASVSMGAATLNSTAGACVILANGRWAATTVAGVASTASPTGGTWGVDYSQQDAAEISYADLVIAVTTTDVTSATSPFGKNHVGNSINVTAGSGCTVQRAFVMSTSTITATMDKAMGTAASTCTAKLGGALSLASSDDAIFELATSGTAASNIYFIKGGTSTTYTIGGTVTMAANGNAIQPIVIEGYNSIRGDVPGCLPCDPTTDTRPVFDAGTVLFTVGDNWIVRHMQFTGTGNPVLALGNRNQLLYSKVRNLSATASRSAITGTASAKFYQVEVVSIRGVAIACGNGGCQVEGSYIHDSASGLSVTTGQASVRFNIFENLTTVGIDAITSANTAGVTVENNTIYGAGTKIGIGLRTNVTGTCCFSVTNNIFAGLVTGISGFEAQSTHYSNWNNFYNNTTDRTNWLAGPNSTALNPTFTNVTQITDATGGYTTGSCGASDNVFTVSGANFTTAGVVAGRDYLYISTTGSGTATVGIYSITTVGTTTLTLGQDCSSSGTPTVIPWQITLGHNFGIGTNLKGLGSPGAFPTAQTTGYLDIGAVQRQESGAGGQKGFAYVQ